MHTFCIGVLLVPTATNCLLLSYGKMVTMTKLACRRILDRVVHHELSENLLIKAYLMLHRLTKFVGSTALATIIDACHAYILYANRIGNDAIIEIIARGEAESNYQIYRPSYRPRWVTEQVPAREHK